MAVLRNPKWEAFAKALADGQSLENAYGSAGFQPDRPNAWRLQQKSEVRQRVDELVARKELIDEKSTAIAIERLALTKESLAREFVPLTVSNVNDYIRLDDTGEPIVDFRLASRAQLAALRSFEVHTYMEGKGKNAREVKKVKFSLWPKVEAGMAIAKLFGWVIEKHSDVSRLEERLEQMTPAQREADAEAMFERAKARLLQDQRERGVSDDAD